MSPDDWRRLYICEPAPPEIVRITRHDFDALRRPGPHRIGYRIKRDRSDRYWTINDAIVEFIDDETTQ